MTKNFFKHCWVASLAVVMLALCSAPAWADDEEGEATDATVFEAQGMVQGAGNNNPQTGRMQMPAGGTYRSDSLGGDFLGQSMYVEINGQSYPFWGARAISLDQDSPLRQMGMKPGDVVSRLDGVRLNNNKFKQNGAWQMPELDRHFGATEVRWIKQGTHRVYISQIMLDNMHNHGGGNNNGGWGGPVTP